jgi:hypothetical protein
MVMVMDWRPGDPLEPDPRRTRYLGIALAAISFLLLAVGLAYAETTRLSNCSQTVGAASAAVPFPASGATGPSFPTSYLEICNAHATNTLGVNIVGGTAAIGAAGTVTLQPGGCMWWNAADIPGNITVIGSAGSTTTACGYR